jgi:diketogulonate reductase-like aldo/keto reductase
LIDTAEMYGDGGAERVVGDAIAGQRERVFLVSKVYPHNATRAGTARACEASLRRLRTDYLDLYLLHWRGAAPLAETVEAFERLVAAGKIRRWGVSNLEFDLLPWCAAAGMAVMAYSPVGQAGRLLRASALREVAARHGATPAQIAIAWSCRLPGIVTIPKAGDAAHVRANAAAATIVLTDEDLAAIDAAYPAPAGKTGLAML